ncbi:hypothetical protein GQ457_03G021730 [Hibiscus cannabinus]
MLNDVVVTLVTRVYAQFVMLQTSQSFMFSGTMVWIINNLSSRVVHSEGGMPWPSLFLSMLCQLWKSRNDFIFNSTCWICLNVDGAVSSVTRTGSIGGLLRDYVGSWISDFQKRIGNCTPLQAELWAIFIGLQYAWDQGVEILQVQSDFKEAVQMLNAPLAGTNSFSLVRAIVKLFQRGWRVDIIWVARSGNQAANALAKNADFSALYTIHMHNTPEFLWPLLSHDASSFSSSPA